MLSQRGICLLTICAMTQVVAASFASGQTSKQAPGGVIGTKPVHGPRYQVENEVYDFGTVWEGARIDHVFTVRNIGDETLNIVEFKPTCHCTIAPDYTRIVPPGGTGSLHAIFNTDKQRDKVVKELVVSTNEKDTPNHSLKITGVVRTVLKLSPIGANFFRNITPDYTGTKTMTLTNTAGKPLKLDMLPMPPSPFTASLKETKPGEEFVLMVSAKPPYKAGSNEANIRFQTNIPEEPSWQIQVSAYLPPRIEISPPRELIDGNQRAEQKRNIWVRNNGQTPFDMTLVGCSDPHISVRTVNKGPMMLSLEMIVPPFYRPAPGGEFIRIKTTDKEVTEIRIPVLPYGVPPPRELVDAERKQSAPVAASRPAMPAPKPPSVH